MSTASTWAPAVASSHVQPPGLAPRSRHRAPGARLVHLHHNKHELTLLVEREPGR